MYTTDNSSISNLHDHSLLLVTTAVGQRYRLYFFHLNLKQEVEKAAEIISKKA